MAEYVLHSGVTSAIVSLASKQCLYEVAPFQCLPANSETIKVHVCSYLDWSLKHNVRPRPFPSLLNTSVDNQMIEVAFSGFSVGCCRNEKKFLSQTRNQKNLVLMEKFLSRFQLMTTEAFSQTSAKLFQFQVTEPSPHSEANSSHSFFSF